jgi:hypothetical protein
MSPLAMLGVLTRGGTADEQAIYRSTGHPDSAGGGNK